MDMSKLPQEIQQDIEQREEGIQPAVKKMYQDIFKALDFEDAAIMKTIEEAAKLFPNGFPAENAEEYTKKRESLEIAMVKARVDAVFRLVPSLVGIYWIDTTQEKTIKEKTERESKVKRARSHQEKALQEVKQYIEETEEVLAAGMELTAEEAEAYKKGKEMLEQLEKEIPQTDALLKALREEDLNNLRAWIYKTLETQLNNVKEWDKRYKTNNYNKIIEYIEYWIERRDICTAGAVADAKKYAGIYSSQMTEKLAETSTRINKPHSSNDGSGIAEIRNGPLTIKFTNYDEATSKLKVSTRKLLDACVQRFTARNSRNKGKKEFFPEVIIPLNIYMEMCGIPDTAASRKKARADIDNDLKTLVKLYLDCEPVGKGRGKRSFHANVCDASGIDDFDNIVYRFSPTFAEHLLNSYMMQYPLALLKIGERNPSTFNIGRKLALHNSMDSNIKRGTNQIISVKSLLEACPDIPSAEQVAATDRHYYTRIIKPFEDALGDLESKSIIVWHYCNANCASLTDEQNANTDDYRTFSNLYVWFSMLDSPNQGARIERNTKKREKLERQKELRALKKLEAAKKQAAEQAEADKQAANESDQTSDT